MADILTFRTEGRRSASRAARTSVNQAADIVIFPGVRYERAAEEPPATKPKRARASKARDRLDIVD